MHYRDTWTKHIPQEKLKVYKRLLNGKQITDIHVLYIRSTGETIVDYESNFSRADLMDLKRRYSHGNA